MRTPKTEIPWGYVVVIGVVLWLGAWLWVVAHFAVKYW